LTRQSKFNAAASEKVAWVRDEPKGRSALPFRAGNADISGMPESVSTARKCPICGKPATERFRPFCSKRCADVDLHRWFSGRYAVPTTEREEEPAPPDLAAEE
jgi:uncharacterized protein